LYHSESDKIRRNAEFFEPPLPDLDAFALGPLFSIVSLARRFDRLPFLRILPFSFFAYPQLIHTHEKRCSLDKCLFLWYNLSLEIEAVFSVVSIAFDDFS